MTDYRIKSVTFVNKISGNVENERNYTYKITKQKLEETSQTGIDILATTGEPTLPEAIIPSFWITVHTDNPQEAIQDLLQVRLNVFDEKNNKVIGTRQQSYEDYEGNEVYFDISTGDFFPKTGHNYKVEITLLNKLGEI